ncbi:hypothetical protein ZWY2020_058254 [Hordeum vulgare]|nr:hypothetical protein ZWY2020_058254 [Hordeum vulgare]
MEAEAHRLRSSALVLMAVRHFSGISAESVARVVERELRLPASDFVVSPFFPEDFLLTLFQPVQRDMALERRSISVAGVMFKLRPWLPPAEGTPTEEGREGASFAVLIHLDVVKDFTPTSPGREDCSAWPRTYRFKGKWRFGVKDGEGRARSASTCSNRLVDRQSDDDEGDAGGSSTRRRWGSRGGVCKRFFRTMRDQAMCRDTTSREPEPRSHRAVDFGASQVKREKRSAWVERALAVSYDTQPEEAGSRGAELGRDARLRRRPQPGGQASG